MGGPWHVPTSNPLFVADDWGRWVRVGYGPREWPSHSVWKFYWEQDA